MEARILPLAVQDIKIAGGVLGKAFQNDPAMLMMFAEADIRGRIWRLSSFFANIFLACTRGGTPLIVRDGMRILSALSLYPPGTYPTPLTEQIRMILKTVIDVHLFSRLTWLALYRGIKMLDVMGEMHPKDPHYYLEFMGVEPDCQGKGMGSMIVKTINQRADEEKVGCYLETAQPLNLPLYKRFGYRIIDEKVVSGITLWFMWRDPE